MNMSPWKRVSKTGFSSANCVKLPGSMAVTLTYLDEIQLEEIVSSGFVICYSTIDEKNEKNHQKISTFSKTGSVRHRDLLLESRFSRSNIDIIWAYLVSIDVISQK